METLTLVTGIILSLNAILYFGLIGLFTYGWFGRKKYSATISSSSLMRISVIIAAKNEEKNIAELLKDLLTQNYPWNLTEIIVVDDRSIDSTAGIVTDFMAKGQSPGLKLLNTREITESGKKAALTLGVAAATGDVILVTDADCRVEPGWISTIAAYFQDMDKMLVFGPVSYFSGEGLTARFQSLEFSGLMASGAGAAMAGYPFICNGANLAYRKKAFLQVKGFEGNEQFISGDDVFLMHKIKHEFGKAAIGFAKDKNALVKTYPVKNFLAFLDQRIRWASKSKGYRDPFARYTAIIVFAFNFFLTVVFITGFFHPGSFLFFAGFVLLKSAIDLPLMWNVTGFGGNRQPMIWYLPFQVVYPFYIVVTGIVSLFSRKRW
jgi:cellulose synthase/poly-beta-1,6-N-acetylglucosamine synthase-like glycosyltransferase